MAKEAPKDAKKGAAAPAKGAAEAAPEEAAPAPAVRVPLRGRRDLWQIPALAMGGVLLALGVMSYLKGAPRPDFEGALADVETILGQQDYEVALERLNGSILEEMDKPEATDDVKARYHALRGDAIYLAQRGAGYAVTPETAAVNNTNVLQEYEKAEKLDPLLIDTRRTGFIAEALLDLGKIDPALEKTLSLPDEEAPRKHRLLKRIIGELMAGLTTPPAGHGGGGGAHGAAAGSAGGQKEPAAAQGHKEAGAHGEAHSPSSGGELSRLVEPEAPAERVDLLLMQLRSDPTLSEEDRLWVTARRAERKLKAGFPGAAIDEIIPELQRMAKLEFRVVGELFLILGKAYLESGRVEMARSNLARAEEMLGLGDDLRGQVDVLLARISQALNELEEARDRYATVVERFVGGPAQVQAYVGLGEVEADLSRYPESLAAYRQAVEVAPRLGAKAGVTPEEMDLSITQRYQARLVAEDLETALSYAELAAKAYPGDSAPASAMLRMADTHLALAERTLNESSAGREAIDIEAIDPVTLSTIRMHFRRAAEEYQRHVHKATITDPTLATNSLWKAADSFDRAGDLENSTRLFTDFMQGRSGDPRVHEARFRLARVFQAKGAHPTAIRLFEQIIAENPGSDEAYRSYVPLAQSHIQNKPPDYPKAAQWLLQVLDGRVFQPTAPQFREALVELGRLYLKEGRNADAIQRLDEALERYPDIAHRTRLEFDLADANRLSATQIEIQLRDAMPLSERTRLEQLRVERLTKALSLYETVRASIEARDRTSLPAIDQVVLRNSVFYRGDCAFDLGQYDTAIRFYDAAAQRYASDPASLVSMVQIVNCYAALEKWREASTAHERAQDRLRELPEGSWQNADVPMDRRHWERWLDASVRLKQMDPRVDANGG